MPCTSSTRRLFGRRLFLQAPAEKRLDVLGRHAPRELKPRQCRRHNRMQRVRTAQASRRQATRVSDPMDATRAVPILAIAAARLLFAL
jgi:hypothetical protein